ncbi:hypothetical protein [Deinococcus peraridilitoris]|uniref:Uncharacterized protein n=1 Tax=Deinococcus peraridilitoris (strain DSM 19664 / LMG 22246 / CIP 109416 / KR-200) TaxID=937777 RepID=K9ZX13_DEIPD|nr:hypothetical protein [Deinococcus peraridilitoris]AFZ66096.1 hypothetical protein Deipe_0500 [Deinococcus peraridilitoris DSM 19664]
MMRPDLLAERDCLTARLMELEKEIDGCAAALPGTLQLGTPVKVFDTHSGTITRIKGHLDTYGTVTVHAYQVRADNPTQFDLIDRLMGRSDTRLSPEGYYSPQQVRPLPVETGR